MGTNQFNLGRPDTDLVSCLSTDDVALAANGPVRAGAILSSDQTVTSSTNCADSRARGIYFKNDVKPVSSCYILMRQNGLLTQVTCHSLSDDFVSM